MNTSRGFTIVELLITMVVMTILMTLAVVNLRATQVQARDSERRGDIDAITKRLNSLYVRGVTTDVADGGVTIRGSYPPTVWMTSDTIRTTLFKDLPKGVLIDPTKTTATDSIAAATNTNTGTDSTSSSTAVAPFPSSTQPYVYQPIADDGSLCTSASVLCRKFNIYSWVENTPTTAIKIESQYR